MTPNAASPLPIPDDTTVLGLVELLLRWCHDHPDFSRWMALKTTNANAIDEIREAVSSASNPPITIELQGSPARAIAQAIWIDNAGLNTLVTLSALANGLDDMYGDLLMEPWLSEVTSGSHFQPMDLVVLPDTSHLERLFGVQASFAVPQNRASVRPDQTRRCRLFEPPHNAPPIRFADDLSPHLDEILTGAKCLATAHPTMKSTEYNRSFPLRPDNHEGHIDTCDDLLSKAYGENASVVVFPEFSGTPQVSDRLRTIRPERAALVIGGSSHQVIGTDRVNRCLVWVARETGNIPIDKPIAVDKMAPYSGALGHEPLSQLGLEIVIQVDGNWRFAVGICRDFLNNDTVSALSQLGTNFVVTPAWSPKTTNLANNAGDLATNGPGIAVVANSPLYFHNDKTNEDVEVPLAFFATPLDRTQSPTLSENCTPPGLCLYDISNHTTAAI